MLGIVRIRRLLPTEVIKGLALPLTYSSAFFVIFLALFGKNEFGIYFLVYLLPLKNVRDKLLSFPGGSDIIDWVLLALSITLLFKIFSKKNQIILCSKTRNIIIGYIFITMVYLFWGSFYFGIDLPITMGNDRLINWKNHIILPLLFFLTFHHVSEKKQIKVVVILIFISLAFVSRHYLSTAHTSGHFLWDRRGSGIFSHLGPNELAAFLSNYSIIALSFFFSESSKLFRGMCAFLYGFTGLAILFTYSRGTYIAFMVSSIFIIFIRKRVLLIVLLVIALCWQLYLPDTVVERIEMTRQGGQQTFESSSAGRLKLWTHGIKLFLKNPLGYGYNTVHMLGFVNYHENRKNNDPHNRFVEFMVEMGIVGIALFTGILYYSFRSGWYLFKQSNDFFYRSLGLGFSACVISVAITNIFGDRWSYVEVGCYFWVVWALVERARTAATE